MFRILTALAVLSACPAVAQQCSPTIDGVRTATNAAGERLVARGMEPANSATTQVFVNAETGTWRIIIVLPTGAACVIMSGVGFEAVEGRK